MTELRGFKTSPSTYPALNDLVHGPRQAGAPAGSVPARIVIGWGRQDKVSVSSEARQATERFPDASLHWFGHCGHFPHWDQPAQTSEMILPPPVEPGPRSRTEGGKEAGRRFIRG
ncbi:MAG: hypothetical protein JO132_16135 [Streptosporangiaceae bacterium]|nr:hypothetical protein [Streptosporangiaceae bacterium]